MVLVILVPGLYGLVFSMPLCSWSCSLPCFCILLACLTHSSLAPCFSTTGITKSLCCRNCTFLFPCVDANRTGVFLQTRKARKNLRPAQSSICLAICIAIYHMQENSAAPSVMRCQKGFPLELSQSQESKCLPNPTSPGNSKLVPKPQQNDSPVFLPSA